MKRNKLAYELTIDKVEKDIITVVEAQGVRGVAKMMFEESMNSWYDGVQDGIAQEQRRRKSRNNGILMGLILVGSVVYIKGMFKIADRIVDEAEANTTYYGSDESETTV